MFSLMFSPLSGGRRRGWSILQFFLGGGAGALVFSSDTYILDVLPLVGGGGGNQCHVFAELDPDQPARNRSIITFF